MHSISTTHDAVRIYRPWLLGIYDFLIMSVLTPYVWKCPANNFTNLYLEHMSARHADVGVGTAYVLDRCSYEPGEVRIALFDLQKNCLEHSARRLARFAPERYLCDAMQALPVSAGKFDSIALGGILHCIPGDMATKGAVFDSVRPLLHAGTTVFGYTILNRAVRKTPLSKLTYWVLQHLQVINGPEDSATGLQRQLERRFAAVEVKVVGCVAIFVARAPYL